MLVKFLLVLCLTMSLGDHLGGKPGNKRLGIDGCQDKVREKILSGKTAFC